MCSDIVEVSDDGQKFWLLPYKRPVLCGLTETNQVHITEGLPVMAGVFNDLLTCFQPNGPKGISPYQIETDPSSFNFLIYVTLHKLIDKEM